MDLTKDKREYLISNTYWKKGQLNLIEQLNISIDNSKKMIENHTASLKLAEDQLAHELKFYETGWKSFLDYCEINGIDPNIEL